MGIGRSVWNCEDILVFEVRVVCAGLWTVVYVWCVVGGSLGGGYLGE